jgi:hypothetical protein
MALTKGNGTTRFDWLKDSRKTHGNSTDSMNRPKPKNTDDTPKGKVAAMGRKNTSETPTRKGNASGGGGVKQPTSSAGNGGTGGNVKMISGIVGSRKQ